MVTLRSQQSPFVIICYPIYLYIKWIFVSSHASCMYTSETNITRQKHPHVINIDVVTRLKEHHS